MVDDASEDGTLDAVESSRGPFPHVAFLDNPGTGKKAGLSFGNREACEPNGRLGIDADARIGTEALAAMSEGLATQCDSWDMALLPLRIAFRRPAGAGGDLLTRLQALDFAAMQGWVVSPAVGPSRHGQRRGMGVAHFAFPHDQLRPDLPSGDDVFALAALIERGDQTPGGMASITRRRWSPLHPCPPSRTLLHQRIRWGAKSTHYPDTTRSATGGLDRGGRAWTRAGAARPQPGQGPHFGASRARWTWCTRRKSGRDMTYCPQAASTPIDLLVLAIAHPLFIATTLLLMPFGKARWKGRPATQFAFRAPSAPSSATNPPPSLARYGSCCGRRWP